MAVYRGTHDDCTGRTSHPDSSPSSETTNFARNSNVGNTLHLQCRKSASIRYRFICGWPQLSTYCPLVHALKSDEVFYMSFKEGQGERRDRGGRLFTDFTEDGLKDYLSGQTNLVVEKIWRTEDARPGRIDRWINATARRV